MLRLFDRLYYTIYRMLIRFGQNESDMPRLNAAILISICTMLNAIAAIGFLIAVTGKVIIVQSKVYTGIVATLLLLLNISLIFYKKRYRAVEATLAASWTEHKAKNVLITLIYIVFTTVFVIISIRYIKSNPITK